MGHQLSEDPYGVLLDLEVLVLHTVEQHEDVFVSVDKRVELRVQVLEHRYADAVFLVRRCGHEKPMQQLVNDTFHAKADTLLVLGERETATSLHGFLADLWIIIIQIVNDRLLDEIDDTHTELSKVVISQRFDGQRYHFG